MVPLPVSDDGGVGRALNVADDDVASDPGVGVTFGEESGAEGPVDGGGMRRM